MHSHGLAEQFILGLGIFMLLGFPCFSILPPILLLKAPKFATNSSIFYLFSFVLFESLIIQLDPMHMLMTQYQGVERLIEVVFPVVFFQGMILGLTLVFIPLIADRCGYRLVLDGSVFGFEVDADITAVWKQLNNLEEDFNLVLGKRSDKASLLYFTKTIGKRKTILQFFLRPNENKTDVVLVMHSITNDVLTRAGRDEVERIGRTFMKWVEISKDYTVRATENENLFNEIGQESKKSFYRQPVAFPSKRVVKEFLREHWKDIAVILSLLVALLSWLLPLR